MLDETRFATFLYTAGQPDPDLLIRTSGEMRVSNFLLWQIAYAEIWVTDTLWPDFRCRHLLEAHRSRTRSATGATAASQPVAAARPGRLPANDPRPQRRSSCWPSPSASSGSLPPLAAHRLGRRRCSCSRFVEYDGLARRGGASTIVAAACRAPCWRLRVFGVRDLPSAAGRIDWLLLDAALAVGARWSLPRPRVRHEAARRSAAAMLFPVLTSACRSARCALVRETHGAAALLLLLLDA